MNNTPSFFDRLNKNSISNMKKLINNDEKATKIMEFKISKVKRQIDLTPEQKKLYQQMDENFLKKSIQVIGLVY